MQVQKIQNNKISFGSVTPIIATERGKDKLEQTLSNSNEKYFLEDLTYLYKEYPHPDGILSKAAKEGRSVLFLITGDEYRKYKYMEFGWSSATAPTRHMNRVITHITENSNKQIQKLLKRLSVSRTKI